MGCMRREQRGIMSALPGHIVTPLGSFATESCALADKNAAAAPGNVAPAPPAGEGACAACASGRHDPASRATEAGGMPKTR